MRCRRVKTGGSQPAVPCKACGEGGVACNIEHCQVRRALTSRDDALLLWIGGVVGVHASRVAASSGWGRSGRAGEQREGWKCTNYRVGQVDRLGYVGSFLILVSM